MVIDKTQIIGQMNQKFSARDAGHRRRDFTYALATVFHSPRLPDGSPNFSYGDVFFDQYVQKNCYSQQSKASCPNWRYTFYVMGLKKRGAEFVLAERKSATLDPQGKWYHEMWGYLFERSKQSGSWKITPYYCKADEEYLYGERSGHFDCRFGEERTLLPASEETDLISARFYLKSVIEEVEQLRSGGFWNTYQTALKILGQITE